MMESFLDGDFICSFFSIFDKNDGRWVAYIAF